MSTLRAVTMDSPRRKKKTRRGKKKHYSWREMIPASENLPRVPEKEEEQPCRCGFSDVRSPVKSAQGRVPIPNKKNKPYLRPSAPRAPHNSTQFIMDCHLNQDFSMYGSEVCNFCHSSPPPSESGSPALRPSPRQSSPAFSDTHFELNPDGELDMVSFVLNDFELVMNEIQCDSKFNPDRIDKSIVFSHESSSVCSSPLGSSCSELSPNSSLEHSSCSELSPNSSPEQSSEDQPVTSNEQFNSWSNASMLLDVPHSANQSSDSHDSSNLSSTTESFLKFMSTDFENELQKTKEESLYEKSSEELMSDILAMQNRANILSRVEMLQSILNEVRSQNEALKSENEGLKLNM